MPPVNFLAMVNSVPLQFAPPTVEKNATEPSEQIDGRVGYPVRLPTNPPQIGFRKVADLRLQKHKVYQSILPRERRGSFTLPSTEINVETGISDAVASMNYHVFGKTTLPEANQFLNTMALAAPIDPASWQKALNFGSKNLVDLQFAMHIKGLGHVIFGSKPFIFVDQGEPGYAAIKKMAENGDLNQEKFSIVEHGRSIGLLSLKAQGLPDLVKKYKSFFIAATRLPSSTNSRVITRGLVANMSNILRSNDMDAHVVLGVLLGLGKDSAFAWARREGKIDSGGKDGFEEMESLVDTIQYQLSTETHALPSIPLLLMDKGPEAKQLVDNYGIESTLLIKRWQILNCQPVVDSNEAMQRVKNDFYSLYSSRRDTETLLEFGLTERNSRIAGADALRELTT